MIPIRLTAPDDVAGWRAAARRLRLGDVAPDQVRWSVGGEHDLLDQVAPPVIATDAAFTAPRAFMALADDVLLNRADDRFDLMYRLLWRLKDEPYLVKLITDPDVSRALRLQKAVWQASHKMHAFVRFRRVDDPPRDADETYAAWFEPPHYVLRKGVGFFVRRLANVRFSIFTPYASAVWDKAALRFGPGADASRVPAEDAQEEHWRAYFASVFNPARLNPVVMTQHMPKHYWRNLPEAALIPELIDAASHRTLAMVDTAPTEPNAKAAKRKARPDEPPADFAAPASLGAIASGLQACRRCDLWREATQAVPGEGPASARIMIVGEQPGDLEDLSGKPFVGPAGALFDRALAEAGLPRETCYVTNAVKHFKHELRGKRRLHKTPNAGDVRACRWWLDDERRLIAPAVIVALGASAASAVFSRPVAVLKERGVAQVLDDGATGLVTMHPAFLLRLPDAAARREAYAEFVGDLAKAKALADGK